MKIFNTALAATALFAVLTLPAATADDTQTLKQERQQLEFLSARVRVELLRDDTELRRLHERIVALQKELTQRLDKHPQMARLQGRIADVDRKLKAAGE
jgi:hypothetical protein